jgi:hypothetical protein
MSAAGYAADEKAAATRRVYRSDCRRFQSWCESARAHPLRGRSTDHCFDLARSFFMAVARERAGFTCHASIRLT